MSPRGGGVSACAKLVGIVLASTAGMAAAQGVDQPATTLPPSPVNEVPPQSPFLPPATSQPALVATVQTRAPSISAVRVIADASGSDAVPPDGWIPPKDASGSVGIKYQPGQPLNAAWVQEQFDRQTAAGAIQPSTAVALVQLVNRAFITAGFINSGVLIAGQPSSDGVVPLRLVYGRLAVSDPAQVPVTVEWGDKQSRGLSEGYIRSRFRSANEQPLNALALERDFRLLDESSAVRSISAALLPGTLPGEASLRLIVHPVERFDFYTGVSNDRSPAVGGDHIFAGALARNLLTSGDVVNVEGGLTRGVSDARIDYSAPLFSTPLSLKLAASFNKAAVITSALTPLDIRARDRSAEAGLWYQFLQSPLMMRGASQRWSASQSLAAGLTFVARRQKSFLLGEPFSFAPGSVDGRSEYEAMRLSANYVRRDLDRVIALSLGATLGLDGTRSDIPGVPNPRKNFMAFLGQLNVAQRIGGGFELRGRLTAQESNGTLYSGLRLGVGGVNSVRGYRESLFLIDRGVIGSLELARSFNLFPESGASSFKWGGFTASLFADGAVFRNAEEPQPGVRRISSVGAALAWTPSDALRVSVAYGHALNKFDTPNQRSLQDRGIHFRMILHPAGIL